MSIPPRLVPMLELAVKHLQHSLDALIRVRGVARVNNEEHLEMGTADLVRRLEIIRTDIVSLKSVVSARAKAGGE